MTSGDSAADRDHVSTRAMSGADWDDVRRIYGDGLATGIATFETEVASREELDHKWHPDQRWVAVVEDRVAGWTAAMPVSTRRCYAGVAETSVYVDTGFRGRGVGRALLRRQTAEPTSPGSGRCRPRSSPSTSRASPCTPRPATASSGPVSGSRNATGSGTTRCCSNGAELSEERHRRWTRHQVRTT